MWATGRYDLGLSEAEFWELTPEQFQALLERRRYCARLNASTLAGFAAMYCNSKTGKSTYEIDDFLPFPERKVGGKAMREMLISLGAKVVPRGKT